MSKKEQPKKRKQHDYAAIRAAYALTPASLSVTKFAAKMMVPLRTLQKRMKDDADKGEPWERDLSQAVRTKTKQMQQRVAAGLGKDQPITEEAVAIAAVAATNILVLEQHQLILTESRELIRDAQRLLRKQVNQGFLVIEERVKGGGSARVKVDIEVDYVVKSVNGITASLDRVVKMERHHLGVDDAESGASYEDDLELLAAEMDLGDG